MKHIKEYENLNNNEPEEGDYVICKDIFISGYRMSKKLLDLFLSNNIGRIERINININRYYIVYDNIPEGCKNSFMTYHNFQVRDFFRKEIKYWSKDREDLEVILQANKYNL